MGRDSNRGDNLALIREKFELANRNVHIASDGSNDGRENAGGRIARVDGACSRKFEAFSNTLAPTLHVTR